MGKSSFVSKKFNDQFQNSIHIPRPINTKPLKKNAALDSAS